MLTYHTDNPTHLRFVGDGAILTANVYLSYVIWRGIDASHDALVVPFEEDSDQREDLDGDVELRRRQLLPQCLVSHREEPAGCELGVERRPTSSK